MGRITQDYVKKAVRSAAILTNAYVAGTVIEQAHEYNQLIVLVDFTKGSLTSLEIKVEFSHDGTNYYQETFQAIANGTATESLGVHSMTASGLYRIPIQIMDRYIKISANGTGTVTSSSCTVDALLGNN
jgi:hypothetical protein